MLANSEASVSAVPVIPDELLVEAEVVLEGHRGPGVVLLFDPHPLLGLDRLVEAVGPAAAVEGPPGELVDDLHLALGDQVVLVPPVELLGQEGLGEVVDVVDRHRVVEVAHPELAARPSRCPPRSGRRCASPRRPRSPPRPAGSGRCRRTGSRAGPTRRPGPEMISGVRASSMRIESTSSTMAKGWPRCTMASLERAMLSRR